MARVLIIEDDHGLLEVLGLAVADAGHEVVSHGDGDAGWRALKEASFDLVISDVNLPGLDGFSLCRKAREQGLTVPIGELGRRAGGARPPQRGRPGARPQWSGRLRPVH